MEKINGGVVIGYVEPVIAPVSEEKPEEVIVPDKAEKPAVKGRKKASKK